MIKDVRFGNCIRLLKMEMDLKFRKKLAYVINGWSLDFSIHSLISTINFTLVVMTPHILSCSIANVIILTAMYTSIS